MKITIKGSPKEIAELAAMLQARQTAQSEKADSQGEAAEHQENKMLSREEARKIVKSMDIAGKEALTLQARHTVQSEKAAPQGEPEEQGLCKEIADAISALNANAIMNRTSAK